jgi:hypothetical protein
VTCGGRTIGRVNAQRFFAREADPAVPPWLTVRFWLAIVAVAMAVAAFVAVAGCASTAATTTAPAAPPSPAASASVPGVPPGGARTGTAVTVHDQAGHAYQVTLTRLVDPARPESSLLAPGAGKRLVAAVFTVTGTPDGENANLDATVAGSNGQTYTAALLPAQGYTGFNSGQVVVPAGGRAVGAVTFALPAGVRVASVSWAPGGGLAGGQPATWQP